MKNRNFLGLKTQHTSTFLLKSHETYISSNSVKLWKWRCFWSFRALRSRSLAFMRELQRAAVPHLWISCQALNHSLWLRHDLGMMSSIYGKRKRHGWPQENGLWGRSHTTLTSFTYLSPVDIGESIPSLVKGKICTSLTFLLPPTYTSSCDVVKERPLRVAN